MPFLDEPWIASMIVDARHGEVQFVACDQEHAEEFYDFFHV